MPREVEVELGLDDAVDAAALRERVARKRLLVVGIAWAENPNVIVIYTDDQGYGDASCLNPDAKFETPSLDRLARGEGAI